MYIYFIYNRLQWFLLLRFALVCVADKRDGWCIFAKHQNNKIMKKLMVLAIAFLVLSCGCQREWKESRLLTIPKGGNTATSVTKCLSGNDKEQVMMKVSRVIDGDTFEGNIITTGGGSRTASDQNARGGWWAQQMMVTVIRINGIDSPERGQFYGDVATLPLQWLISGKTVGLKLKQRGQYGRWIATVYLDGKDIGEEMLKQGLAWHYKEYDCNPTYSALEAEAKQDGRGLWSDERAVAPWVWRKMGKFERDAYR